MGLRVHPRSASGSHVLMRIRTLAVLIAVVWLGITSIPSAQAQDGAQGTTSTTSPELAGAVGIGDNLWLTGAVITPADGPTRTLDAYQAAVFVQSWLPTAIYGGNDILQDPPPELPVNRVDISGQWGPGNIGWQTVYLATDGTSPYVSWPQDQPLATEPGGTPPPPADWFLGEARVLDAFNGEAELIDTQGTRDATSTTTVPGETAETATDTDGSSSGGVWAVIGAAILAAGVAAAFLMRRRSA